MEIWSIQGPFKWPPVASKRVGARPRLVVHKFLPFSEVWRSEKKMNSDGKMLGMTARLLGTKHMIFFHLFFFYFFLLFLTDFPRFSILFVHSSSHLFIFSFCLFFSYSSLFCFFLFYFLFFFLFFFLSSNLHSSFSSFLLLVFFCLLFIPLFLKIPLKLCPSTFWDLSTFLFVSPKKESQI